MRLVFIAGGMRSGSTLLAELVGSCHSALAVGELTNIWWALGRGGRCSCGDLVSECAIWGSVAKQVQAMHGIGLDGPTSYAEFDILSREVMRAGRLLTLHRLRSRQQERLPDDICRFVNVMRTVFESIAAASGCSVIIDSSKRATALIAFGLVVDLQITPLHLVRDPRAVAFSESRQGKWPGLEQLYALPGHGLLVSALLWNVNSILCHLVGTGFSGYQVVRYEQLAADPRSTMKTLCADLELEPPPFAGAHLAELAASHVVDGNPSRFGSRLREIYVDDRWRTEMSRTEQIAVVALTAPVRFLDKCLRT